MEKRMQSMGNVENLMQTIGHKIQILWDETEKRGILAGISFYDEKEFPETKSHDFTEVYYIERGTGKLKTGDLIREIKPGMAVVIPEGIAHTICCDEETEFVKVFWVQLKSRKGESR